MADPLRQRLEGSHRSYESRDRLLRGCSIPTINTDRSLDARERLATVRKPCCLDTRRISREVNSDCVVARGSAFAKTLSATSETNEQLFAPVPSEGLQASPD